MKNSNLGNIIILLKKSINKITPIMIVIFMMQIGLAFGPIGDSVKAEQGNTVFDRTTSGVKINVTDSSNQSIPQYVNNGGSTIDTILKNPKDPNVNGIRLAAGATAKISYALYDVIFSKYKFVKASDLTTKPQFPADSAMINIDLPAPNTGEAYKDDLGDQGYITTKHYVYKGKAGQELPRDVSFGTPVSDGVLVQQAICNTDIYETQGTNSSAFLLDMAHNNVAYGNPNKNAAVKAMKLWGYFCPQRTGSYILGAYSDDGAYGYIMVDGVKQVFVEDWRIAPPQDRSKSISMQLTAGKYYPIYMEWYEGCPTQAAFVPRYRYNDGHDWSVWTNIPQNEFYSSKTTTPGDIASAYFGDVSGIPFPAQDGVYYIATKFVSMEGTTQGLYGPFIIDNTKPVLNNLTVTSNNPNGNKWAVAGNKLTIKFTASENLSANPQILINGYAVDPTITKDSQNNYTATVNIGSDGSVNSNGDKLVDGPINVQVAHYSDLSGNEGDAVQDSTVIYDNTAPKVAITYSANPTSVGTEKITAIYSEPVNINDTPKISIDQPGSADIISQSMMAEGTDRKIWSYNYTVNADNGSTYRDGTATVNLSTVHDAAGNTAEAPTGNTFKINTKAPTVTLTFSANPVKAGIETITAVYSAPVNSNETPKISIAQQGTATMTPQLMTVGKDRTTWTYNYTVNADNGSTYKDGVATVTLSTVHDGLGNTAEAPQVNTFIIDTKPPTVSLSYSANPAKAGTETITATYSEPINTDDIPKISIDQQGTEDITLQNMTAVGSDRKVWIYNYTVNADNGSTYKDGTATVSLSSVHDAAGNAAIDPTGNNFTIDTIAPTVSIGAPSASITNSGPITYTVTYSGEDKVTLNSSNVSLVKTGTADGTVTANGNTRTVTVSNITGRGTLGIRIAAGTASDNAGNTASAPPDSATFTVNNASSIVLKQGIYMSNNSNNEYILTNINNQFDVVKTMPITVGMMVEVDDSNPQIALKIEGSLKNNPIKFNKYEVVKNSTTNKYVIKSDTLQSYKPSSYSSEITFTNNMDNSNFSLEKGKQYIIFYSIIPSGDSSQIKISADVDKVVDTAKPTSQIILNVVNLPPLQ